MDIFNDLVFLDIDLTVDDADCLIYLNFDFVVDTLRRSGLLGHRPHRGRRRLSDYLNFDFIMYTFDDMNFSADFGLNVRLRRCDYSLAVDGRRHLRRLGLEKALISPCGGQGASQGHAVVRRASLAPSF